MGQHRTGKVRCCTQFLPPPTILKTCEDSKAYAESWLLKLLAIAKPKAEKEDPEGLYLMYQLTLNNEYLKKSAASGYGLSQYKLALFIKGRQYEKFRNDESRQRRVEELMQASSENGYPKAMNYRRDFFAEKEILSRHDIGSKKEPPQVMQIVVVKF